MKTALYNIGGRAFEVPEQAFDTIPQDATRAGAIRLAVRLRRRLANEHDVRVLEEVPAEVRQAIGVYFDWKGDNLAEAVAHALRKNRQSKSFSC